MKELIKDLQKKYNEIINEKGNGPLYSDGWMKLIYDINKNEIRFQIDSESVRKEKYKSSFIPICFSVQNLEHIEDGIKSFYTSKSIKKFLAESSSKNKNLLDKRYINFSSKDLQSLHKCITYYKMKIRQEKFNKLLP
jgi:hypothetical protein